MDNDGPQEQIISKKEISRKNRRYLSLAKKMAECSTYGNFRHGAVLVRGGAIINFGINSEKYSSIGAKYRPEEKGVSTYHAEIKAILNIPRSQTKGAVMYVARASKGKKEDRMSKPCTMCHAILEERGVSQVFYTVDNEVIGTYKF
jgi:deoxycytidylate deaminase